MVVAVVVVVVVVVAAVVVIVVAPESLRGQLQSENIEHRTVFILIQSGADNGW